MSKRVFLRSVALVMALSLGAGVAWAEDETPDGFVKRVATEVLETIKADKTLRTGDPRRLNELVDARIMPHVNFQRMTASAVGPAWRQASPEQKERLQAEFKTLLTRTYAGAVSQVSDQSVVLKPLRAAAEDKEVLVRTEVRGKGEPIQMDYRLEKTPGQGSGWKIYNLNVLGVWLVENYRSQFAQEINTSGVDGLINTLAERNKAGAKKG